jgi:hypothetical protein
MPFYDAPEAPGLRIPTYEPASDQPPPAMGLVGAAFRQDNTVVNLLAAASRQSFPEVEGYNPLDDIRDSRFEQFYPERFVESRSPAETLAIKARIEGEERDRRLLDSSGIGGTALQIAAGILDPTILLPAGQVYRATRGGYSVLRSAASVGAMAAAQTAGQEAVLQATQETRTGAESATAVASATLLGGLIGGGAAALLSRVERIAAQRGLDEVRATMGPDGGSPLPPMASAAPVPAGASVVGEDKFGQVLSGFEGSQGARWREAVDWLRANEGGEVPGALYHPDLGDIDLVWGRPDGPEGEGFGLAKIVAKHPEVLDGLQDMIAGGNVISRTANRVRLASADGLAVVRLDYDGEAKTWLVTAFDPRAGGRTESPGGLQADSHSSSASRAEANIAPADPMGNANRATENITGNITGSVGAAATDTRRLQLARSGLTDVPVVGRLIEKTSPTMRVFSSPFTSARRMMADLAETALEFVDNAAGVPTTRGATLDRLVRTQVAQARVAVADEMDRLFSEMRFNGQVALPAARAWGERLFGRDAGVTGIPRTMEEFRREVGRAMRRGDQHEIPQVAAAAQFARAKVFEPWKARAIEAKLLPPDVDVKTAESYFQRVYDKGKINADRPAFEERILSWLRGEQDANARTQARIAELDDTRRRLNGQIGKLEARVRRAQARTAELTARLDEAAGTVARGEKRADVLEQRQALLAEEIADIEGFINDLQDVARDPATREAIDRMQRELVDLRRADRAPTLAQVEKADREELAGLLTGERRMAAEILVGRRKPFKPRSFLSMIVRAGGIADDGGEVLAALGGDVRTRPGLVNADARDADAWGEKLMEMSEGRLTERPEPNEVLNWIHEAARGNDPSWWRDVTMTPDQQQRARASELAAAWDEIFQRAGIRPQKVADVAAILRDERRASGVDLVTLDDLDRIAGELEAVGEDVPVAARRAGVEEELFVRQSAIREARAQIAEARKARDRRRARARDNAIREGEASVADTGNRGRLRILEDRMSREEERGVLVDTVLETLESLRAHNRRQIEEAIGQWRGQSTSEAMAALRRVAELTADRAPGAPRLSSADRAVDRAVKRILRSQKDLADDELRDVASQIIDRIVGSPDGRLPYDMDTAKAAGGSGDAPRGPLAARRFNIPDTMIEDWLVDDVEEIAGIHLRTMVPDVLLAERYGDADMTAAFRELADEHARLAREAGSETERVRLRKEYDGAVRDLAAVRDRIRGTFGFSSDSRMRNLGRAAQAVRAFNTITMMGGAAVSSLSDAAGAVFRHGFGTVLRDAWVPLAKHLAQGLPKDGAYAEARRQYRAMGLAAEMALGQRHQSFDEIGNVYRPGSRLERALAWGADRFQVLNLLAPWTDMQKTMAAVVSGNELLRATKAAAEGKASARQVKNLAAAGIDQQLAGSIWREFSRAGEVIDGVHLPNTGDWTSREARDAFEAAVGREVDIAVITPGQEKPLWMSDPILATFGQFKAFTAAATERVLIANLQRHDAQSLQGVLLSVALGALSYRAYALASGQETSDRPQDWIKEGVSRAGLLGWLEEGNALAAKATRGSVDIYRAIGADKPLSKFASRSVLGQLLGPTAGRIEALTQVTGAAASGDWSAADSRRLRSFMAMQNLFYLRRGIDQVEAGLNEAFGVPPMQ